jgi:phosphoribulokinase
VSNLTTIICLDDYHLNDRSGQKGTGLTALNPLENNFDLVFEPMQALKIEQSISKHI